MAINEKSVVASHEDAGPGYRFLVLEAPRLAADLTPGQFVHVRVPGLESTALRRPFSVFDADAGRVTLLYKVVGRGTAALSKVLVGDTVEVMGPLGHGFPSSSKGVPLLVGGGYGVAPLHFLAKRLIALDRFAALGVDVRIATNDGSAGEKGFVTGPLDAVLDGLRARGETFELFTCGPDGLLKAVADRAVAAKMPGWISMDRHMVCGVGACYACIQKTVRGNSRCCVEGPVFRAEDLVW